MPSKLVFRQNFWNYSFILILFFVKDGWRQVVANGALLGIPMPCFSTALSFYDGYRSEKLPANLIQVDI